ncbi:MAG: hypothetical protein LBG64_01030 [Pseudomonadales bacterium]|jgi:hypothetical protein|nr:hypothetical protein [Pseudomonadales bacterium]
MEKTVRFVTATGDEVASFKIGGEFITVFDVVGMLPVEENGVYTLTIRAEQSEGITAFLRSIGELTKMLEGGAECHLFSMGSCSCMENFRRYPIVFTMGEDKDRHYRVAFRDGYLALDQQSENGYFSYHGDANKAPQYFDLLSIDNAIDSLLKSTKDPSFLEKLLQARTLGLFCTEK